MGIDSCNVHRTGTMCGKCEANWTESLFSRECVHVDSCQTAEIMVMYVAGVVVYSLGLITFVCLKDVAPNLFKKQLEALKQRYYCRRKRQQSQGLYPDEELKPFKKQSSSETNPDNDHWSPTETHESNSCKLEKELFHCTNKGADKDDDVIKYVQILFYHVQDATLFKVKLPFESQEEETVIVKILQFSPEILTTLYNHMSNLCFAPGATATTKILLTSLFGPCVILLVLFLYLGVKCLSFITGKSWQMLKSKLVLTFLLVVLFSFQKLVIGAFTLVKCIDIGNSSVLYMQGDIQCYTWWQRLTEVYICFNVIPVLFYFSVFPFHVEDKTMTVKMFVLGCLFPTVVLAVFCTQWGLRSFMMWKGKQHGPETESLSEHTVVSEEICAERSPEDLQWQESVDEFYFRMTVEGNSRDNISNSSLRQEGHSAFGSQEDKCSEHTVDVHLVTSEELKSSSQFMSSVEKQTEPKPDLKEKHKLAFNNSREAITYTLLKHYRCLSVFGFKFTWLGVHKLYRVGLVACDTYITEPLQKLCMMSTLLMVISVVNTFVQPYKDRNANKVAVLSYATNICIAVVNIMKVMLVTFGCQVNCGSGRDIALWYFGKVESILLVYLPVILTLLAVALSVVQKCFGKKK